jgi:hypothetical protein
MTCSLLDHPGFDQEKLEERGLHARSPSSQSISFSPNCFAYSVSAFGRGQLVLATRSLFFPDFNLAQNAPGSSTH